MKQVLMEYNIAYLNAMKLKNNWKKRKKINFDSKDGSTLDFQSKAV